METREDGPQTSSSTLSSSSAAAAMTMASTRDDFREIQLQQWVHRSLELDDDALMQPLSPQRATSGGFSFVDPTLGHPRTLFWRIVGAQLFLQDRTIHLSTASDHDDMNSAAVSLPDDAVSSCVFSVSASDLTLQATVLCADGTLNRFTFQLAADAAYLTALTQHESFNPNLGTLTHTVGDGSFLVTAEDDGSVKCCDTSQDDPTKFTAVHSPDFMKKIFGFMPLQSSRSSVVVDVVCKEIIVYTGRDGSDSSDGNSGDHARFLVVLCVHSDHTLRVLALNRQTDEVAELVGMDLTQHLPLDAAADTTTIKIACIGDGDAGALAFAVYASVGEIHIFDLDLSPLLQQQLNADADDQALDVAELLECSKIIACPIESAVVGLCMTPSHVVLMAHVADEVDGTLTTLASVAPYRCSEASTWHTVLKDTLLTRSLHVPHGQTVGEAYSQHLFYEHRFSSFALSLALASRSDVTPNQAGEMSDTQLRNGLTISVENKMHDDGVGDEEAWSELLSHCVSIEEKLRLGEALQYDAFMDSTYLLTQAGVDALCLCNPIEALYWQSTIRAEQFQIENDGRSSRDKTSLQQDMQIIISCAQELSKMLPSRVSSDFIKKPLKSTSRIAAHILNGDAIHAPAALLNDAEGTLLDIRAQLSQRLNGVTAFTHALRAIEHLVRLSPNAARHQDPSLFCSNMSIDVISRRCRQVAETLALFSRGLLLTAVIAVEIRNQDAVLEGSFTGCEEVIHSLSQYLSAAARSAWCTQTLFSPDTDDTEDTLAAHVMRMMTAVDPHPNQNMFDPTRTQLAAGEKRAVASMGRLSHWLPAETLDTSSPTSSSFAYTITRASELVLCTLANDIPSHAHFSVPVPAPHDMQTGAPSLPTFVIARSLIGVDAFDTLCEYVAVAGVGSSDGCDDAHSISASHSAILSYIAGLSNLSAHNTTKGVAFLKSALSQFSSLTAAELESTPQALPSLSFLTDYVRAAQQAKQYNTSTVTGSNSGAGKSNEDLCEKDRATLLTLAFIDHCFKLLIQTLPNSVFVVADVIKPQYIKRFKAAFFVMDFLRSGLSVADHITDADIRHQELVKWWARRFEYALHLDLCDEAFMATNNNPDPVAANANLHQLVSCLFERRQLEKLVHLPYNAQFSVLVTVLERLVKGCDIVAAVLGDQSSYYEVLYSLYVFRHDYRTAAYWMASKALHLAREEKPVEKEDLIEVYSAERDAYLAAINALSLVKTNERFVVVDVPVHASTGKRSTSTVAESETKVKTDIMTVEALREKYVLVQALVDFLFANNKEVIAHAATPGAHSQAQISGVDLPSPTGAVELLAKSRRFDDALNIAYACSLSEQVDALVPLFEHLSEARMVIALSGQPCSEDDEASVNVHADTTWVTFIQSRQPGLFEPLEKADLLIVQYLEKLDGVHTQYKLTETVCCKFLSALKNEKQPLTLPPYLSQRLLKHRPALLIDVYVRYEMLESAIDVATTLYTQAKETAQSFVDKSEIILPYNKFDELERRFGDARKKEQAYAAYAAAKKQYHRVMGTWQSIATD